MKKYNYLVKRLALFAAVMSVLLLSALAAPLVTVSLSPSSIDENSPVGSVVGDIDIVYTGESADTPAVFLSSGDDNFSIVSDESGYQLVTDSLFDYETASSTMSRSASNIRTLPPVRLLLFMSTTPTRKLRWRRETPSARPRTRRLTAASPRPTAR
jgi:hypothetical protein